MNIPDLLQEFATSRPIFHSEADFQHALAWFIQEQDSSYRIRLEYRLPRIEDDKRKYIDILASREGSRVAIELKYKTLKLDRVMHGEQFNLLNQGAQDHGRYDFLVDIQRLEKVVSSRLATSGFALLLTNDSLYWKPPRSRTTVDAEFRLHDSRKIHGKLDWDILTRPGTKAGRNDCIDIQGNYDLRWSKYFTALGAGANREFKYLLVQVGDYSQA